MKTGLIKRKYGFDVQNLVLWIFEIVATYIMKIEILSIFNRLVFFH